MIRPQFSLDLNRELIVDNFAGGGGASTGIERALGRQVDHAINHSIEALGMHRINHPQTIHHCEDVFDVDPTLLTEGRPVGMGWFSPDCKHFSKAKGGKPLDQKIRGLVLVMLRWAKIGTRVMFMENVEEIQTWGPLMKIRKGGVTGWYPDPKHKGRTWKAFLAILGRGIAADHPDLPEILAVLDGTVTLQECVRGFGYAHEVKEIRACDAGTPTIRKRLFMIARCDGKPIVWPAATHFAPDRRPRGAKPWATIAECIDWERPCPSIFLTKRQARVARCKRPLAKATLRRIATGIDRYVLRAAEPFLVSLTHQGGDRIEPTSEPAKTITGAHRGEKALVMPFLTEHAHGSSPRNHSANAPLRTACAGVKGGHFAAVAGTVVQTGYGERDGQAPRALDPQKPLGTIVSGGKHAVVTGALVHTAHGERDRNGKKRGRGAHDVGETMPSVLASSDCAIAAANLVKLRGNVETHSKPESAAEPLHAISAGGTHHGLVAAHLTKFVTGSVGADLRKPGPTVTAGAHSPETHGGAATTQGLAVAYLAQHNGGFNVVAGHHATEPLSTISSKGSQQQLVAGSLMKYNGTDQDPRLDEPAHSVTTKDRLSYVESTAVSPMTEEQIAGARRVAKFLRSHGVVFEGEFATVAGFVIVDIGMRMLTPRELFRAQGFPEDYVIDRAWIINPRNGDLTEMRLTKEQQIRMCGNSACPPVAESLVRANVPELATWYRSDKKRTRRAAAALCS